jgi:hypothetical protein
MATLSLAEDARGNLMFRSTEPIKDRLFSIFSLDGRGPWLIWSDLTEVEGIHHQEYDPRNINTFWDARKKILDEASTKKVELPDYVEIRTHAGGISMSCTLPVNTPGSARYTLPPRQFSQSYSPCGCTNSKSQARWG